MSGQGNSATAYLEDRPVLTPRQALQLWIIGPLLTAVAALGLLRFSFLADFENTTIDWRFRARGERPVRGDIIVVAIDEESRRALSRDGRQFGVREHLATLINNLADAGALVVGLDIWVEGLSDPAVDQALAEAIANANVVLATSHTDGRILRWPELFLRSQPQEGVVTVHLDARDFAIRRLPQSLFLGVLGESDDPDDITLIPHFPLALALYAVLEEDGGAEIRMEGTSASIGASVAHPGELVDWAAVNDPGGRLPWTVLPFSDVVTGRFEADAVDGAVVIVGSTRTVEDVFATPLRDSPVPGVYYHANVTAQLLEGRHFDERWTHGGHFTALVLGLTFLAGLFAWHQPSRGLFRRGTWRLIAYLAAGCLIFLGGWITICLIAFGHHWRLPMVAPFFGMVLALSSGLAVQWVVLSADARRLEARARKIEALFGQSVSQKVLEALQRNPESVTEIKEREVSVLFCDLRNFTEQTSDMDPGEVASMLNEYFNYVTGAVFEFDGFLDKFVGDEVMAVFSVPFHQENHADRAVQAAVAIKQRLAELNVVRRGRGEAVLDCGLGVHCGMAAAGHIGSRERSNYTVVGSTVNMSARIENFTRGGEILISEAVRRRLSSDLKVARWDEVQIRGIQGSHVLYEVLTDNDVNRV